MFVFTAKLTKKRAVIAVLLVGALLIGIILLVGALKREPSSITASSILRSNEERIAFLTELGWEVEPEPMETQTVVIPQEFPEVFLQYNELQQRQGFDLTDYSGLEATRYTYRILNYPNTTETVVADLIVYRGRIIAGDIQCVALDGFMDVLVPKK